MTQRIGSPDQLNPVRSTPGTPPRGRSPQEESTHQVGLSALSKQGNSSGSASSLDREVAKLTVQQLLNTTNAAQLQLFITGAREKMDLECYAALEVEIKNINISFGFACENRQSQDLQCCFDAFISKAQQIIMCQRTDLQECVLNQQNALIEVEERLKLQAKTIQDASASEYQKIVSFDQDNQLYMNYYLLSNCVSEDGLLYYFLKSLVEDQSISGLVDTSQLVIELLPNEDRLLKALLNVLKCRKKFINAIYRELEVKLFVEKQSKEILLFLNVQSSRVELINMLPLGKETHNEGKLTYKIELGLDSGNKFFVYKPRPAYIDIFIIDLLKKVILDFKAPNIQSFRTCSIWDFIEGDTARDPNYTMTNVMQDNEVLAQLKIINYVAFRIGLHDLHENNFIFKFKGKGVSSSVACPIDLECLCVDYMSNEGTRFESGLFQTSGQKHNPFPEKAEWTGLDNAIQSHYGLCKVPLGAASIADQSVLPVRPSLPNLPNGMRCRVVCAPTNKLNELFQNHHPSKAINVIYDHVSRSFKDWKCEDRNSWIEQMYIDWCNGDIPYFYTENQKEIYCGNPSAYSVLIAKRKEDSELQYIRPELPETRPSPVSKGDDDSSCSTSSESTTSPESNNTSESTGSSSDSSES